MSNKELNPMTDLTAAITCHNVNEIRYPWKYAALSILPVVEDLILVDAGPHIDDTSESLAEFARTHYKTRVMDAEWARTYNDLSHLTNLAIDAARTAWFVQVQADEILDENDYMEIMAITKMPDYVKAATFKFRHFIGDFKHIFNFIYDRTTRMCRVAGGYRAIGDAMDFAGHGHVYHSSVTVNHVGKIHVGREKAGAFKEYDFQNTLYKDMFATDPRIVAAYRAGQIDYFEVFKEAIERGEVQEYRGPYPEQVRAWARELRYEL